MITRRSEVTEKTKIYLSFLVCFLVIVIHTHLPGKGFHRYPVDCVRFFPDFWVELCKYIPLKILNYITFEHHIFLAYRKLEAINEQDLFVKQHPSLWLSPRSCVCIGKGIWNTSEILHEAKYWTSGCNGAIIQSPMILDIGQWDIALKCISTAPTLLGSGQKRILYGPRSLKIWLKQGSPQRKPNSASEDITMAFIVTEPCIKCKYVFQAYNRGDLIVKSEWV